MDRAKGDIKLPSVPMIFWNDWNKVRLFGVGMHMCIDLCLTTGREFDFIVI